MDINTLSKETYKAVFAESNIFHKDLFAEFKILADKCADEDDFLGKIGVLIFKLRTLEQEELGDVFQSNIPEIKKFHSLLNLINFNITNIFKERKKQKHQ